MAYWRRFYTDLQGDSEVVCYSAIDLVGRKDLKKGLAGRASKSKSKSSKNGLKSGLESKSGLEYYKFARFTYPAGMKSWVGLGVGCIPDGLPLCRQSRILVVTTWSGDTWPGVELTTSASQVWHLPLRHQATTIAGVGWWLSVEPHQHCFTCIAAGGIDAVSSWQLRMLTGTSVKLLAVSAAPLLSAWNQFNAVSSITCGDARYVGVPDQFIRKAWPTTCVSVQAASTRYCSPLLLHIFHSIKLFNPLIIPV